MPATAASDGKLHALTSLRFFAAVMVVIHHLNGVAGVPAVNALFPLDSGVSFFYVLSGFILTHVYASAPVLDARRFLLARFARIWPAHVTALACMCLLLPDLVLSQATPTHLLANLALVHAWIPLSSYYFSFVAPSWSISVEVGFYLCFLWLVRRWDRTWYWKLPAAFLLACAMIFLARSLGAVLAEPRLQEVRSGLLFLHPLARLFEFTLGMATALFWRRRADRMPAGVAAGTIIELLVVAYVYIMLSRYRGLAMAAASVGWIGQEGSTWLIATGGCIAFAPMIFVMASGRGLLSRALSVAPLLLLGEMSYSIYLLHQMFIIRMLQDPATVERLPHAVALACFVLLVLSLAFVSWVFVERPSRAFLLGLGRRPATPATERPSARLGLQARAALGAGTVALLLGTGWTWLAGSTMRNDGVALRNVPAQAGAAQAGVPAQASAAQAYQGHIDIANDAEVAGWIWNRDAPGAVIAVRAYDGGEMVGWVAADVLRDDLVGKIGDGRHAFRFATPARLQGEAISRLRLTVAGSGFELRPGQAP